MFLLRPDIFAWDLALLALLALSLSGTVACAVWLKRRKGNVFSRAIVSVLGLLSVAGMGLLIYGSFVEPHIIVITEKSVPFPAEEPLTIAVLGDFHAGPYKGRAHVERAVRMANAQLPDIVLLSGDYILGDNADLSMLEPLGDLRASLGVFAVLGNHDVGRLRNSITKVMHYKQDQSAAITAFLENLGIPVLINEHQMIHTGTTDIAVAGVLDLWTKKEDLEAALSGIEEGTPTILLSHNPGIALDDHIAQAALVVSGHTHGGQIRLPLIGPLTPPPTDLGWAYDQGAFAIGDTTTLVLTRGLGESSPRARLFSWPEVLVLRTMPHS